MFAGKKSPYQDAHPSICRTTSGALRQHTVVKSRMVRLEGETSNTKITSEAIFETLRDWNDYLEKSHIELPDFSVQQLKQDLRGPKL